jgi:hypothetical protein
MSKKEIISKSPLHERAQKNENSVKNQISVDETVIKNVLKKINNKPRLAFWDHTSAAVLHYLKETKPNFSMSAEIARLTRKTIKEEYPDIWKAVITELRKY